MLVRLCRCFDCILSSCWWSSIRLLQLWISLHTCIHHIFCFNLLLFSTTSITLNHNFLDYAPYGVCGTKFPKCCLGDNYYIVIGFIPKFQQLCLQFHVQTVFTSRQCRYGDCVNVNYNFYLSLFHEFHWGGTSHHVIVGMCPTSFGVVPFVLVKVSVFLSLILGF